MLKEKRLNVKAESSLVDAFIACCEAQDMSASQIIRKYMRDYVRQHAQQDLFVPPKSQKKPKK